MGVPAPSLQLLLADAIDYAGLFPPAKLPLDEAVRNFASYAAGPERWALGRFVVPLSRLGDFEAAAGPLAGRDGAGPPWRVSVLTGPDIGRAHEAVTAFNARHEGAGRPRMVVDTAELRAFQPEDVAKEAAAVPAGTRMFFEIPVESDPAPLVRAIGSAGGCAKVRTGGIKADMVPGEEDLLRFLAVCVRERVPFKATAGLHHPIRGEYPLTYEPGSARGTMHGFLNVLLAAAALHAGFGEEEALTMLRERNRDAFVFTGEGVRWGARLLPLDAIAAVRNGSALSFGSCSFREPFDDLHTLGMF